MIPEDKITLYEAYDLHYSRKYHLVSIAKNGVVTDISRTGVDECRQLLTLAEMLNGFRSSEIVAHIGWNVGEFTSWWDSDFAHMVFIDPELPRKLRGAFSRGQIPFVDLSDFEAWSEKASERVIHDSFEDSRWSYGQTVAWIAFRVPDFVREISTLASLELFAKSFGARAGSRNADAVADANCHLQHALTAGEIEASATDVAGQSKILTNLDWSELERVLDSGLQNDEFQSSSKPHARYHSLNFARLEILDRWPATDLAEDEGYDVSCLSLQWAPSHVEYITPVIPAWDGTLSAVQRAPSRDSKVIKQDIERLLDELIKIWKEAGKTSDLRITNRKFIKMVTGADSEHRIADAKRSWADQIWRAKEKPSEWMERGPFR